MSETRDFNDPEYKKWRQAVRRRDKFKCVLCGSKRKLHVHHIKTWARYPNLRYELSNGCVLCASHHRQTYGKEEQFEQLLLNAISPASFYKVRKLLDEYGE